MQGIQSQYPAFKTIQARDVQQLLQMQEKRAELEKAEYIELSLPLKSKQKTCSLLLEQRAELETSQATSFEWSSSWAWNLDLSSQKQVKQRCHR